jgi:hypothetical protein
VTNTTVTVTPVAEPDIVVFPPMPVDAPTIESPRPSTIADSRPTPASAVAEGPEDTASPTGFRPEHAALALWLAERTNGDDLATAVSDSREAKTVAKNLVRSDLFSLWGRI